jgi:hypothetical protein
MPGRPGHNEADQPARVNAEGRTPRQIGGTVRSYYQ